MEDSLSFWVLCLSSLGELTRPEHCFCFPVLFPNTNRNRWLSADMLHCHPLNLLVTRVCGRDSWVAALLKCHKSSGGHIVSVVNCLMSISFEKPSSSFLLSPRNIIKCKRVKGELWHRFLVKLFNCKTEASPSAPLPRILYLRYEGEPSNVSSWDKYHYYESLIAQFYFPAAPKCAFPATVKICPFDEPDVFISKYLSDWNSNSCTHLNTEAANTWNCLNNN